MHSPLFFFSYYELLSSLNGTIFSNIGLNTFVAVKLTYYHRYFKIISYFLQNVYLKYNIVRW